MGKTRCSACQLCSHIEDCNSITLEVKTWNCESQSRWNNEPVIVELTELTSLSYLELSLCQWQSRFLWFSWNWLCISTWEHHWAKTSSANYQTWPMDNKSFPEKRLHFVGRCTWDICSVIFKSADDNAMGDFIWSSIKVTYAPSISSTRHAQPSTS